MTNDDFTEAARTEAERADVMDQWDRDCFVDGAEWARSHLAAQEVHRRVRKYADDWDTCTCGYDAWPCRSQEPTDAEAVRAFAEWMNHSSIRDLDARRLNCTCGERGFTPYGYEHHRLLAALSAARTARRDEENR